jgi:integrase
VSLHHLGGQRWKVVVSLPPDGTRRYRQRTRTFTAPNKTAAKREASRHEAALYAEINAVVERTGTIAGLVDDWLEVKRRDLSPTTVRDYERWAGRIVDRWGRKPAADLTGRDVDRWFTELADGGMEAGTIQHGYRVLRALLRYGYQKRGLPKVATDHCTPPSHQAAEIDPPTTAEVVALVMGADGAFGNALRILAGTGMRRGEVVGLRWDDLDGQTIVVRHSVIDRKGGGVIVKTTKGKRTRTVLLAGPALPAIDAQVEHANGSPWVFPNWMMDVSGQTPMGPNWISGRWGRYRKRHGAESVRLHDLRHWFATTALAQGVEVNVVAAQLGHAQASTTLNIYGHATQAGVERLRVAMGGQLPITLATPQEIGRSVAMDGANRTGSDES